MLDEAFEGAYPVRYPTKGMEFTTIGQFLNYADKIIERSNCWDIAKKANKAN